MYKIIFNDCTISTTETENEALAHALHLHQMSNINHNISVQLDAEIIIYLRNYDLPTTSQS